MTPVQVRSSIYRMAAEGISGGRTHGLVGRSPQIENIRRLIEKAARNRLPVLLLGESGTGKEVVARAIHNANPCGRCVPIDCGSLVGTLMESELFGHAKGAFSGATEHKKGLVELADGGTAFFDEIGDLPLEMQVKLLRLIQEREFRAVGALQWRKVDIRIIAATHHDLKREVAAGRFRQDLFYRLNVFTMHLPPLRDRRSDIPLLVDQFLDEGEAANLPRFYPGSEILEAFLTYDWPGNVRELKHCIDRMAALHSEGALQSADLPSALQNHLALQNIGALQKIAASQNIGASPNGGLPSPNPGAAPSGLGTLADFVAAAHDENLPTVEVRPPAPVISIPESEKQAISVALEVTRGERGKAAKLLKTSRTTLYRKMKQYGIE